VRPVGYGAHAPTMIPITEIIDIGNTVLCDMCNDDYTNNWLRVLQVLLTSCSI
jgi:hypothetical protein